MSRLIDIIEKAGQQSAPPLGFGAAAGKEQAAPDMVLIESVRADRVDDSAVSSSPADAIVVQNLEAIDGTPKGLEERVWGARAASFTLEQSTDLADKGCDFVVFESLDTHAALVNDEDLGVIATVPVSMEKESVRSLVELPVDGVLFTPPLREIPLTMETLMAVQALRGMTDKPLLVEAPDGLDSTALESLRLAGVNALIVHHDSGSTAQVKESLLSLPRRKDRPRHRSALVPPPASTPSPSYDEDEDDLQQIDHPDADSRD